MIWLEDDDLQKKKKIYNIWLYDDDLQYNLQYMVIS